MKSQQRGFFKTFFVHTTTWTGLLCSQVSSVFVCKICCYLNQGGVVIQQSNVMVVFEKRFQAIFWVKNGQSYVCGGGSSHDYYGMDWHAWWNDTKMKCF